MSVDLKQLLMPLSVEPLSDEMVAKRQDAFMNLSRRHDLIDISMDLIRCVFSLQYNQDNQRKFTQLFIDADTEFPQKLTEYQLRVLAATALIYIIDEEKSTIGSLIALGVVNCFAFGVRKKPQKISITTFAESELDNQLMTNRVPVKLKPHQVKTDLGSKQIQEYLANPQPLNQPQNSDLLSELLTSIISGVVDESKAINSLLLGINKNNQILQDECDILWWIASNASTRLNKYWSDIPLLDACIVAGMELADLVTVIPGPLSSRQMIQNILAKCSVLPTKAITLLDISKKVSLPVIDQLLSDMSQEINELTPIHLALKTQRNTSSMTLFRQKMHDVMIDVTHILSVEDVAMVIFRERMFAKALLNKAE